MGSVAPFQNADKWSEDFAWIQATYPRLTKWQGRVGESAADPGGDARI